MGHKISRLDEKKNAATCKYINLYVDVLKNLQLNDYLLMHHFKKLTRYKVDAQKSVLFNITVTENMTMKIHFNFSKNFLERTIHFNKVESILGLNNGIIS